MSRAERNRAISLRGIPAPENRRVLQSGGGNLSTCKILPTMSIQLCKRAATGDINAGSNI